MTFLATGRTRYGDPASDFVQEVPSEEAAHEVMLAHGFTKAEQYLEVGYYTLATLDAHGKPTALVGYVVPRKN